MNEFMLVLRGSFVEWRAQGPEQIEKIMERYNQWVGELNEKEIFVGGSELTGVSKMLKGKDESMELIDGPYAESKECLTGYFIIKAKDLNEATEIAKGCPALTHGETVEILPHGSCEV